MWCVGKQFSICLVQLHPYPCDIAHLPCVTGDTNPAPFFKPDGSVEMMWRTTVMDPKPTACPAASCMALATAPSWRGPYNWSRTNIFAGQLAATRTHIEDAHVWLSPKDSANPGSYHAIFHSDVRFCTCTKYYSGCCALEPFGWLSVHFNCWSTSMHFTVVGEVCRIALARFSR